MSQQELFTLGIDIGSTTVKIAILDDQNDVVFSDYEWHFANINTRGFIVLPDSFQWFVKPCQQVCHIHFLGE